MKAGGIRRVDLAAHVSEPSQIAVPGNVWLALTACFDSPRSSPSDGAACMPIESPDSSTRTEVFGATGRAWRVTLAPWAPETPVTVTRATSRCAKRSSTRAFVLLGGNLLQPTQRDVAQVPNDETPVASSRRMRTVWYVITRASVDIAAPAERVWEVFTDVEQWPSWTASVSSLEPLDGPAIAVGHRFRIKQPRMPALVWQVTEVDAPRSWTWAVRSAGATTEATHEVSPCGVDAIYDKAIAALGRAGGYMASAPEKDKIQAALWPDGKLSRTLIARDADVFARGCGLPAAAESKKFFMVEETGVGRNFPFSSEKLSLVLAVYRARDFDTAITRANEILAHQGRGHSVGLHTKDMSRGRILAQRSDVVRVLINQAHTFGNGGSFDNGLNFTLSMGCGTWGGNSITENLNYRHFLNITHLVTTIPEDKPSEEALFGAYWKKYGK